jgi:hypothetical protein
VASGRTFAKAIREAGAPFVEGVVSASSGLALAHASGSAEAAIPTFSPKSVGRIAVLEMGSPLSCTSQTFEPALDSIQTILALKALVHETRYSAFFACMLCVNHANYCTSTYLCAE